MNSAISYLSAAQRQADAIRESYRNPPLRPVPQAEPDVRRTPRRLLLRAALLARL
jgi:hypothetical protein